MKKIIVFLTILCIIPINSYAMDFEEVSKEEKYYKTTMYNSSLSNDYNINPITVEVTKEEYDSFDPNLTPRISASTTTTYKKLTTYILTNGNYYRYKVTLDWRNMPKVRSYDTIGIGHYSSVIVRGSLHFSQTYCEAENDCRTTSSYYPKTLDTGSAATFKLPSGDFVSMSQVLYFDVEKRNPSTTIVAQKATGDYSHAVRTVTSTQARNFDISNAGIQYSSSVSDYFDNMSHASASWTETW